MKKNIPTWCATSRRLWFPSFIW